MKFIPGSSFVNNTMKYTKYFKRGCRYTVKNISQQPDGKMKYIFTVTGKDTAEKDIVFNTPREADMFLELF